MATYSTTIHQPAATAPAVTHKYARCTVCGIEWQIQSDQSPPADGQGCGFCDAPSNAIVIISEGPSYGGAIIT